MAQPIFPSFPPTITCYRISLKRKCFFRYKELIQPHTSDVLFNLIYNTQNQIQYMHNDLNWYDASIWSLVIIWTY